MHTRRYPRKCPQRLRLCQTQHRVPTKTSSRMLTANLIVLTVAAHDIIEPSGAELWLDVRISTRCSLHFSSQGNFSGKSRSNARRMARSTAMTSIRWRDRPALSSGFLWPASCCLLLHRPGRQTARPSDESFWAGPMDIDDGASPPHHILLGSPPWARSWQSRTNEWMRTVG